MAENARSIADEIRAGLVRARRPDKAEQMRAYLKSTLPCLGVPAAERREIVDTALRRHQPDRPLWRWIVLDLWAEPTYREERHAAIDVLNHPGARDHRDLDALDICEQLIREGAWWDLVDATSWTVGDILAREPVRGAKRVREWIDRDDIWLRRAVITAQRRAGEDTDTELLTDAILASVGTGEFFLDKAIGWALRAYAGTDPAWVDAFVAEHEDVLAPLSVTEATRRRGE